MAGAGAVRKSIEDQLAAAGLENLGVVEHLSHWPRLMQESPLMQDFTPAEADILGSVMIRVKAQPGQVLIGEDDSSDWMMLLLSGTVEVVKRKIGAEIDSIEPGSTNRLAVVKDGASLGEMSMLDGEPRYASCIALSEVEAVVLARNGVARLITTQPAIGAKLLVKITQLLAQRLRNTSNQVIRRRQRHFLTGDRAVRSPAARNIQQRHRGVARCGRQQPDHRFGNLVRRPAALHRNQVRKLRHPVGNASRGMDFGFDQARTHGVDPDAFRRHFFRQADRESVDRAFGRGVVHVLAGRSKSRRRTRQIDDRAAAAAMARAHAQHRFAGADDRADHVDVEHALQAGNAHRVDPGADVDHAGAVDQPREPPQLGVDLLEHGQHLLLAGNVGLDRHSSAPGSDDLPHHIVCGRRIGGVVDRHLPAGPRGQLASCRADAAAAASHQ